MEDRGGEDRGRELTNGDREVGQGAGKGQREGIEY